MFKYTSAYFPLKRAIHVHKKAKTLSNVHIFGDLTIKNMQKIVSKALSPWCAVWRMNIHAFGEGESLKSRAYLFSQNSAIFFHVYNFTLKVKFVYMV